MYFMSAIKIGKGDIVKHDSIDFELTVVSVSDPWVTCEWADESGFRNEQKIDKNHLTVIKPKVSMLDAM